ncbi:MAG: hypothetical protein MJZ60_00395 [Bacteroidaceae bacterium]|nr:hypothetical protein [Bacteroidaceae bacterium]
MDETTLTTLIALAEANEGCMPLNINGIKAVRTDDELNVYLDMEDGRTLRPGEIDQRIVDDAIIQWRQEHAAYFQRIIGAMM